MDDGENMAAILNGLLKIDVRQFLDDKHNSKLVDTVNIELAYSF